MTPTDISNATHVFQTPKAWQEQGRPCGDLMVRKDGDIFSSAWQPTPEELEILGRGGVIILSVAGGQPPVALHVEMPE